MYQYCVLVYVPSDESGAGVGVDVGVGVAGLGVGEGVAVGVWATEVCPGCVGVATGVITGGEKGVGVRVEAVEVSDGLVGVATGVEEGVGVGLMVCVLACGDVGVVVMLDGVGVAIVVAPEGLLAQAVTKRSAKVNITTGADKTHFR